jgi:DNA-binding response OmpR family regulator
VTVLVVEDEERVASFLEKGLRAHGYAVEWAQTGEDALRRLMHAGISLVILDLGLPGLDGLDVLAGVRERGSAVPVLVLSARGRVDDRVKGLNRGADDYLGKPFAFEELLARVRANLRPRATISPSVVRIGGICIDLLRREVTVGGRTVNLSSRPFAARATACQPRDHAASPNEQVNTRGQRPTPAGPPSGDAWDRRFLFDGGQELPAGLLTAPTGLLADPAVLVMLGMPPALVTTALAGGHAGFQQRPGDAGVVVRLAADHPGGGGADIDTIEAQPDALDHLGQVLLGQVGVGVGGAGLGAVAERVDGGGQHAGVSV